MNKYIYNENFYLSNRNKTILSSELILEIIFKKIDFLPSNIIDIGCGTGEWLDSAHKLGIKNITGIDGTWVTKEKLINNNINLMNIDLNKDFYDKEFHKYDFLICTEVIEHLDPKINDIFINKICNISDIILFSGAIPGQRGTNHINCQWQSYWKNKFHYNNFSCFDLIRPLLWNNDKIDFWLKQNLLIYIKNNSNFINNFEESNELIDIIHPEFLNIGIKRSLGYLYNSLVKKIK